MIFIPESFYKLKPNLSSAWGRLMDWELPNNAEPQAAFIGDLR